MEKILQYMQVPKIENEQKEYVKVPDVIGTSAEVAASMLEQKGLIVEIEKSGTVVSQIPAGGETVEKNSIVKIKGDTETDTTTYYGID